MCMPLILFHMIFYSYFVLSSDTVIVMLCYIVNSLQGGFPEGIEEYLEHGSCMKCIAFNRRWTLLAGNNLFLFSLFRTLKHNTFDWRHVYCWLCQCPMPTHVITFNYVIFFFKLLQLLTCQCRVTCLCNRLFFTRMFFSFE